MGITYIWYYPRHREDAEAQAAKIPGARVRSIKGWNGRVEEPADRVIVDNDAPMVAAVYRQDGAEVEWLYEDAPAPEPESEPEPEPEPEGGGPLPDGYRVERSGTWYKVIGPDGEQVGNAKRDEDEAIAQVIG